MKKKNEIHPLLDPENRGAIKCLLEQLEQSAKAVEARQRVINHQGEVLDALARYMPNSIAFSLFQDIQEGKIPHLKINYSESI